MRVRMDLRYENPNAYLGPLGTFFISLSFFVLDYDISLSMKLTQLCPKSI